MATPDVIRVFEVMNNTESVSGTPDGNVLARVVAQKLQNVCKYVVADFGHIVSISNSASCAFWENIKRTIGESAFEKIEFINLSPPVLRGLEYGAHYVLEQSKTPSEPSHL